MHTILRWAAQFTFVVLSLGSPAPSARAAHAGDAEIILSETRPVERIPVSTETWRKQYTSVEIRILRIQNPRDAPFSILVALEPKAEGTMRVSAEIGVLGVYPAGQTGSYRLEAASALRQLRSSGADTDHLCLRLELRAVHPGQSNDGLKATLSTPRWRRPD